MAYYSRLKQARTGTTVVMAYVQMFRAEDLVQFLHGKGSDLYDDYNPNQNYIMGACTYWGSEQTDVTTRWLDILTCPSDSVDRTRDIPLSATSRMPPFSSLPMGPPNTGTKTRAPFSDLVNVGKCGKLADRGHRELQSAVGAPVEVCGYCSQECCANSYAPFHAIHRRRSVCSLGTVCGGVGGTPVSDTGFLRLRLLCCSRLRFRPGYESATSKRR